MGKSSKQDAVIRETAKSERRIDRKTLAIGIGFLALGMIVQLISGILAGLVHDWMRMCVFVFGSYLTIVFGSFVLLREEVERVFRQLATHFVGKYGPVRVTVPIWVRIADIGACILVPLQIVLAVIAGLSSRWLAFGLYLFGCGTVVILPWVLVVSFRIRAWSGHLKVVGQDAKEGQIGLSSD